LPPRQGNSGTSRPPAADGFSWGDFFETFAETGLEIKAKSPLKPTCTIELANGCYGYLPTPAQHQLGGYETWLGTNTVEIEASTKLTAALLDMFGELQ